MRATAEHLISEELVERIAELAQCLATLPERIRQASSPTVYEEPARPIEFLTENGFAIVRPWEAHGATVPEDGNFRFLVRDPLDTEREVSVEIEVRLCADTMFSTRGTVSKSSSFWICCAERHLANHLWEHNAIPEGEKLTVDCLDPEEVILAVSWDKKQTR